MINIDLSKIHPGAYDILAGTLPGLFRGSEGVRRKSLNSFRINVEFLKFRLVSQHTSAQEDIFVVATGPRLQMSLSLQQFMSPSICE